MSVAGNSSSSSGGNARQAHTHGPSLSLSPFHWTSLSHLLSFLLPRPFPEQTLNTKGEWRRRTLDEGLSARDGTKRKARADDADASTAAQAPGKGTGAKGRGRSIRKQTSESLCVCQCLCACASAAHKCIGSREQVGLIMKKGERMDALKALVRDY